MFEALGKFVASKWYAVIALWAIVLIISAPLSGLFLKSVNYQVTISVPGSTSAKAEHIVSHYFNLSGASGSNAIIIVRGNSTPFAGYFANLTSYGNISITNYYSIEKDLLNKTFYSVSKEVNNLTVSLQNISNKEANVSNYLAEERVNITSDVENLIKLHNGTVEVEKEFVNTSSTINKTTVELLALHKDMLSNYSTFTEIHKEELTLNQTAYNISKFLYLPILIFLKYWTAYYNLTHNVTASNEYAYSKTYPLLSGKELDYFYLFYQKWENSQPLPDPYSVAQLDIENISNKIFNSSQLYVINFMFKYVNLTNFDKSASEEIFTINFFNVTYKVPFPLAKSLLFEEPLQVLITLYSEKTGLPESLLESVFYSTQANISKISLELLLSKANSTNEREFIKCVYENLSQTPQNFAVNYVSLHLNVSQSTVKEALTLNSTQSAVSYVAQKISNKTGLSNWFIESLYYEGNVSNLSAYLISLHLTELDKLLNASNLTARQLALELLNASNARPLAISLIVNYINSSSPIVLLNKTLLKYDLLNNYSYYSVLISGKYPVYLNITNELYSNDTLLLFLKGNFTYDEAKDLENLIYTNTHLKVVLTGAEPISEQLKDVAAVAYSTAIPVGIFLAILLAGIYFRSFIAAFMPLTIYISAFFVSSVFLYIVVIKLLHIAISFLVPSEVLLLSLGLGTDYVVFIASRYVEEREKGVSPRDAVYEAVRWGGRAVTITALIVMVSFLFIYVYDIPFFSDTAISDMLSVIIIWLASITLFPSILRAVGDKLFFPRRLNKAGKEKAKAISHPGRVVGIISALVIIAAVFASFTPLTLNVLALLPQSQATEGVSFLSSHFTSANVFPIYVVIPYNSTNGFTQSTYGYTVDLYKELTNIYGVTAVYSPVSPYGYLVNYTELKAYNYTQYLSHGYILFVVNQKYQPFSLQAFGVVKQVLHVIGNRGYVGGGPVDSFNIYNFVQSDFFIIVGEIAVTMFILLLIMTRSLSISAVIIYVIMSAVAITLGLERLVFNFLLGYSIFAVVPIFLVAIIIGIGMDYNIFLVARIHEELEKGKDMSEAIATSVGTLRLTIAFLGLIFAGTLGSLMLVNASILQELGFAFAVAAILETSVLWAYLAPSLMLILYRKFKIRPKLIV
ncbi:MMPL family transporter [Stygiolobus caldivivus]|uniref:Antibiotic transporter n=1 Tax=Stygiolobus caldivivus TaxID=2824673 RepID=A0A8D5ZH21_9CREN|nr:MMPL family transporter [Stygiolobus caldivivus]BCU71458.1 antibiotic transporter [Stygiolobus caldivivus]